MTAPAASSIDLVISGMTCAACVRRIENALGKVDGVRAATVNLASRQARVLFEGSGATSPALLDAVKRAGYEAHVRSAGGQEVADDDAAHLRRKVVVSTAVTVPLVVIAMSHGLVPAGSTWWGGLLQGVLATAVVFGPGLHILVPAVKAARHLAADMNTLVSLGVLAAWGLSSASLFAAPVSAHHVPHLYYEAAAAIITLVLIGKLMESGARRHLNDAVAGLVALRPAMACRVNAGGEEMIPADAVVLGDHLLVRPGERLPADGTVVTGTSTIDAALVTGESMPLEVSPGDLVRGGTLNQSGPLVMAVSAIGDESTLGQIIRGVNDAQGSRAPIARIADRVSAVFVPIVLAIAVITFLVWAGVDSSSAGIEVAIVHAVAVLVIACPCALGLATPAAVAVGIGRAAELGVIFKGGAALETASRIDLVLLDKTGTLTTGHPSVKEVITVGELSEADLLAIAAAAEHASEHPLARAIVIAATQRGVRRLTAHDVHILPGHGLRASVNDAPVLIGTVRWLESLGIAEKELTAAADDLARRGQTPVAIAMSGIPAGVIGLLDAPHQGAHLAIRKLHALHIDTAMLTGDRPEPAQALAKELDIAVVHAQATPADKATVVAEARARGRVVAMVGDGLNDAPALAGADVGIAIGTGTDVAQAAGEIVLVQGGIATLPIALHLARQTMRTIRENLAWAFVYNLFGIPLAAGVLVPAFGWSLSPVVASMAMALSSVSVLVNSLRLRRALRSR